MLTTNKLNKYIQGGATKPTISREIETALNFKDNFHRVMSSRTTTNNE